MNPPNIIAVGLMALAMGLFAFAVVLGGSPLFMDVEAVLTAANQLGLPSMPEGQQKLLTALPWLTGMALFLVSATPAAFLAAAGLAVWRRLGRPRIAAVKEEALNQPAMEKTLQQGFDGAIQWLLDPSAYSAERLLLQIQRVLLVVDPSRRHRLFLLGHAIGLAGIADLALPRSRDEPAQPSAQKVLIGLVVGLVSLLATTFVSLWPIVMLLFAPVMEELLGVTLGVELTSEFSFVSIGMVLAFAAMPFTFGVGMLRLSRLENRLLTSWREQRKAAESLLLEAFQSQILQLRAAGLEPASSRQERRGALHSLITADLYDLSNYAKEALMESLRRAGLGSFSSTHSESAL